jgi:glucose/arabinose dehydrogenase
LRQSPGRVLGAVLVTFLVGVCALLAQSGQRPPDPAAETYRNICAGCHGATLSGGRAPTLLDDTWRFGGDDASVTQSILDGRPGTEMAPFRGALTDAEVKSLVAYIRNQSKLAATSAARAQSPAGQTVRSERETFRFEVVADGLSTPWGLAFLPDGRLLITERSGALRIVDGERPLPPIAGIPAVWTQQDGGLFDVAVDPEYGRNGWIYLSYAEPAAGNTSMTAIIRGRVKDRRWVDQQTLYRATSPDLFSTQGSHFGSRFLFDRDGHLFYSIGDRGHEDDAQDLSRPAGKIHRINPDGTTPRDNPFVGRAGALASIWTLGHRNPQGLTFHPVTGKMWATEHGPTGGDELNRIERGHNYGWPLVTSGKVFPARPSPATPVDTTGFDAPMTTWSPSIGPGGIAFYTGDRFPNWKHHLFVTGLAGEALRRLETDGDRVVHEEIVFKGFGRVRDVVTGPDGLLYIALNVPGVRLSDTTPGLVVRLVPAPKTMQP